MNRVNLSKVSIKKFFGGFNLFFFAPTGCFDATTKKGYLGYSTLDCIYNDRC